MAMLQFKMGNWADLEKQNKVAGTVYITKDERSMYVDIDNSTRIRINDIIQHASATDAKPPFSTEAFYYFQAENALMKYNGVDAEGNHLWVQLNSTADVANRVSTLEGKVSGLETKMTTAEGNINNLKAAVGTSTGIAANADGTIYERILANKEAAAAAKAQADKGVADAATAQAKADANATNITTLQNTTNTQATDISGIKTRLNTAESDIDKLEQGLSNTNGALGASNDGSEKTTAFGRIKALEETTGTHTTQISNLSTDYGTLNNTVSGISTKVDKNIQDIAKNAKDIEALQTAVGTGADGLASKVTDLQTRMGSAESSISTLQGDLNTAEGTIKSQGDKISALETFKTEHTTAYNTLNETVGGHTTSIQNLQSAISGDNGLEKRVAANETAIGKVSNPTTGNATGTIYERIKKNAEDIDGLTTRMGTAETAITKLNGNDSTQGSVAHSVKTATDTLRTELLGEIGNKIVAANAMEYQDGIASLEALQALTNVKIGYTYIATSDFKLSNNTQVRAGDLLVANGTEDTATGFITGTIEWDHVNTGYKQDQEPTLTGANNEILLSSYISPNTGNKGKIAFAVEENCSATVKVANNTVTIGIEWGEFK